MHLYVYKYELTLGQYESIRIIYHNGGQHIIFERFNIHMGGCHGDV